MDVHSAVDSLDFFVVFDLPHPDFLVEPGVIVFGVDTCPSHAALGHCQCTSSTSWQIA